MQVRNPSHVCLIALIIAALFVTLAPAPSAQAQENTVVSTTADTQNLLLAAKQDATIVSRQPAQNFGAQPSLIAGRQSLLGGEIINESEALVQWDLSGIPAGTTIESAEIGLYQTSYVPSGNNDSLLIFAATEAWDATAVTWETRPGRVIHDRTWVPSAATGAYKFHPITPLVQQWVNSAGNPPNYGLLLSYGGSGFATRVFDSVEAPSKNPPVLRIQYTLPPIRVCLDQIDPCRPAEGASVYDKTSGQVLAADGNGLIKHQFVQLGNELWAHLPVKSPYAQARLFHTTAAVTAVATKEFQLYTDTETIEMRLLVRSDKPLLLYDLNLTSQWYLNDDPAFVEMLRRNIVRASDFLYDFTEGQFALGTVTVRQMYEGWDGADIKLLTSNVLHPNATIGGIVLTETADIAPTVPISYTPGSVFMGSYWNRFGAPPNQPVKYQGTIVPPEQLADDWSIALAHELGHYLLFLFDTYTDENGVSNQAIAAQCVGSAMGDAYAPNNHAFVANPAAWGANCAATEAYARLNGRTEWATIAGWYSFAVVPGAAAPGGFPPVPLTNVVFVSPAATPPPLASQVYALTYQINQMSSGEARAFLLRNDSLIFEQGKPARGTTSVELTDARAGDRLCVYDLNDHAEAPDTPRHQFGCETVAAGDSQMVMTLDPNWNPAVTIEQTGAQQLRVTVAQTLGEGLSLQARLIPETDAALPPQALTRSGSIWTSVFNLSGPVEPVYLQLWVDESPAAPQTRREVIADRGTGGNGAYGPARHYGGVLTVSSDGNAAYQSDEPLELAPGESVAWQTMPGTPPVPPFKRISGQSYRLDAFPPALVSGGTISIEYEGVFGVLQAAQGTVGTAEAGAQIHFWDGAQWRPLPTTVGTPTRAEDGVGVASAPSQGVGVYAVMIDSRPNLFMPVLRR